MRFWESSWEVGMNAGMIENKVVMLKKSCIFATDFEEIEVADERAV